MWNDTSQLEGGYEVVLQQVVLELYKRHTGNLPMRPEVDG